MFPADHENGRTCVNYRKLELLFLTLSLVAVLSSIIYSFMEKANFSEILGQALFVPVLFIALHYGRQQGFLAASIAALIYLIAKAQDYNTLSLASVDGQFMIARAGLFGLIGIFGSELAMRTKYLIAKLSGYAHIDDQTHLYTQNYLQKLISKLFHGYQRQARPFAVMFITVDWAESTEPNVREKTIPRMANIIRDSVRLIDEVGYLSDRCFCLVLPETHALAAQLVWRRIEEAYIEAKPSPVNVAGLSCERILSMPENEAEIRAMLPVQGYAKFIA